MSRYIVGDAIVELDGLAYPFIKATISVPDEGVEWEFEDLRVPTGNVMDAVSAVCAFGSYYTSDNRGDDVPNWAPSPEVADAIEMAVGIALMDDGEYVVEEIVE